jgi:soluble lytic murein transglycosylase
LLIPGMDYIFMKSRIMALLLSWLMAFNVMASSSLTTERARFTAVFQQLKAGNFSELASAKNELTDYPLQPYLDYYALSYQPDINRLNDVQRFVAQYPQSYLSSRLTESYAYLLMQNNMWQEYLQLQPVEPQSMTLRCAWYMAQYKTGQTDKAVSFARNIWFYGHSRPATCDSLFSLWKDAGGLNDEDIWKRMVLAFKADEPRLMNHLLPQMSNSNYIFYASKLISVYAQPDKVDTLLPVASDSKTREIVGLALQHWADKSTEEVLARYLGIKARYQLSEGDLVAVKTQIARDMMLERIKTSRSWLDNALLQLRDNSLLELRVRLALAEMDWRGIKKWINLMPRAGRDDIHWSYWLARAEQQLGNKAHAKALFQQASYDRSYYGFMAAIQSGMPIRITEEILKPEYSWQEAARLWPALLRIEEWIALDETGMARNEWMFLLDQSPYENKLQLGLVAQQRGWAHLGIQASIRAKAKNALALRFPTPKQSVFARYAKAHDVDASLLYALARQESAMYERAQSQVGASGLMQLMPATAALTAKKLGETAPSPSALTNADTNVRLGSAYIKGLLDQYDGNRVLAAAAYNAGPGRVRKWRRESSGQPVDLWVENIPYKETRNYVQNVMVFNAIYQERLNQPVDFLSDSERRLRY